VPRFSIVRPSDLIFAQIRLRKDMSGVGGTFINRFVSVNPLGVYWLVGLVVNVALSLSAHAGIPEPVYSSLLRAVF
jgi:hypothetical protein